MSGKETVLGFYTREETERKRKRGREGGRETKEDQTRKEERKRFRKWVLINQVLASFVLPSGEHCSLGERLLEKKVYRVEQIGEETMDQREREREREREQ